MTSIYGAYLGPSVLNKNDLWSAFIEMKAVKFVIHHYIPSFCLQNLECLTHFTVISLK